MKQSRIYLIIVGIIGIIITIFGLLSIQYFAPPEDENTVEDSPEVDQSEENTNPAAISRESLDIYDNETDVALEELLNQIDQINDNVTYSFTSDTITITSNGLPDHAIGEFPNNTNLNSITEQNYSVTISRLPLPRDNPTEVRVFGIAINGILLMPNSTEQDATTGWRTEAFHSGNNGLDQNNGTVDSAGLYHYKGIPIPLVAENDGSRHSPLIGFASDGYPIYAQYGFLDPAGTVPDIIEYTSSWRLREGARGEGEPVGNYDGSFTRDFEYQQGSGILDQCNGTFTVTPEFPDGTYAYFLTTTFPYIPRCVTGNPDDSFLSINLPDSEQNELSEGEGTE